MFKLKPKILLPVLVVVGMVTFSNFGYCAYNGTEAPLLEAEIKENTFLTYEQEITPQLEVIDGGLDSRVYKLEQATYNSDCIGCILNGYQYCYNGVLTYTCGMPSTFNN